jgi:hypothetical protein
MKSIKDLNYYKNNCEEDYIKTPISVLRYITELEQALQLQQTGVIKSVCEIEKEFEKCPLFKQYDNGCYGCNYRKQTVL